jgi:protein Mpv17
MLAIGHAVQQRPYHELRSLRHVAFARLRQTRLHGIRRFPNSSKDRSTGMRTPAFVRAFGEMQQRSPWITQLCTSAIIFYLGDALSQAFTAESYQPLRGLRALLVGAGLAIPGYTWFTWLARSFNGGSYVRSLGIKILLQQVVFMPLVQTYFFSTQILLSGGSITEAKQRVVDALPVTWINSWKVWPAVMLLNLLWVPLQYKSIFNSLVGLGWQTYMAWVNQRADAREKSTDGLDDMPSPISHPVRQVA